MKFKKKKEKEFGWFSQLNPGNPEYNAKAFNHAMGTGSAPTEADMGCSESLDEAQVKKQYVYDGPIYRFEKVYSPRFRALTWAVSDKQAKNNIIQQAKAKFRFVNKAGGFNIDTNYLSELKEPPKALPKDGEQISMFDKNGLINTTKQESKEMKFKKNKVNEDLSNLNADYLDDHMKKYLPIGKILYDKETGEEVYVAKHFPDNGIGRYRHSVYVIPTKYKDLGKKAISQSMGLRCSAPQILSGYGEKPLTEDTIKQNGKWVNKGKEGTHGKFNTKKAADAQRKAMFANGYKEDVNEGIDIEDTGARKYPVNKAIEIVNKFKSEAVSYPYWVIRTNNSYDPEGLNIPENGEYSIEYAGTKEECLNKIKNIIVSAKSNKDGCKIESEGKDFVTVYYPHAISKSTFSVKKNPNKAMFANGEKMNVKESITRPLRESREEPYFSAFITNLGKYNEGELVGKWVEFPIDEDDFEEELKEIGIGSTDDFGAPYEEWFVTDYDTNIPSFNWEDLGEYPSYDKLQEFGELVVNIDDVEAVSNAMEVTGDLEEAIIGLAKGDIIFYRGFSNMADFAQFFIDEMGGVEEMGQDTIESYFDFEALGRDLSFDTYEGEDPETGEERDDISAGEYWCGDENASNYDIGIAYVDAVGFEGVANPENYFDYDLYGRDLSLDNFTLTSDGVVEYVN